MSKQKLYIYLTTEDAAKTGILSPSLNQESCLQHYADRAKSTKKSDIIKWLNSTFPNRAKSISVLTEKIPLDIQRCDLLAMLSNCSVYQIDIQKLLNDKLISSIWQAIPGKENFKQVSEINYDKIDWPTDKDKWGFIGIKHYQLVLKDGKIPAKYIKKGSMYEPPYTLEEIKQNYPAEIYNKLKNDPVHLWRATTGIELIHRQPSLKELIRVWKNWNEMTDKQKEISDKKSAQLFHLKNFQHFNCLIHEYDLEQKQAKALVKKYNKRDMQMNNLKYIHLSKSAVPLTMHPRIPKNAMRSEDNKIKRICFSTSILQASGAINTADVMYIHIPEVQPKYVLTTDEIKDKVQDAPNTGQVWILDEEVKTKVIGKVYFRNYWNDDSFFFPLIYTDNRGVNVYTYFKDYTLELFPQIYSYVPDKKVFPLNIELDDVKKEDIKNISKFYHAEPIKHKFLSNPINEYIFITPYKSIASCFLNRSSILKKLLPCKNLYLEYSPFKNPNTSQLNNIPDEITIWTNYELDSAIQGESTGYIEQIKKSDLDIEALMKVHNTKALEWVYVESLKISNAIQKTVKWTLKSSKRMLEKYGKVIFEPQYVYLPITKEEKQKLYIARAIEKVYTNLKDIPKNSYSGFLKIPYSIIPIKTDKFYFHTLDTANQYYSFSFEKSDLREFTTESEFLKIYNSIMQRN